MNLLQKRLMYHLGVACVTGMLLLASATRAAAEDRSVSKDSFLAVLEALQKKVDNIDLVMSSKMFKVDEVTGEPKSTPFFVNQRLVMAGAPGSMMRWERDSALPWVGDDGKYKSVPGRQIDERAFDGKKGTQTERYANNDEYRGKVHCHYVRPGRCNDMEQRIMVVSTHLALIAPYYEDKGLAQFLKAQKDWELLDAGDGTYVVRYTLEKLPDDERVREVTVDFCRGAAITGVKHVMKSNGQVSMEYKDVVLKDCGNGVWLPESADRVYYDYHELDRITYTKAAVNQNLPSDIFVLAFEPGQLVIDEIANTRYIVGPNNDASLTAFVDDVLSEASTLAELDLSGAPVAKAAAAPPPVRAEEARPAQVNRLLVALVILLVLVVVVLTIILMAKGRRGRPSAPVMILCAFAVGCAALVSTALASDGHDNAYEKNYFGTRVPVFQCGLFCAIVQLKSFGRGVNPQLLKEHLACTADGTNFLALKTVLEAHGLLVKAVKSLSAAELRKHLTSGGRAVLATRRSGAPDHFFSVVGCGRDFFIYVDYPSGCRTLDEMAMSEDLAAWGGIALLIANRSSEGTAKRDVLITPVTKDVGELKDMKEDPAVVFNVVNRGTHAAAITSIRASCGCMNIRASAKWLDPGQSADISCTLSRQRWGSADSKHVYVNFADGGASALVIKAKGLPAVDEAPVTAQPGALYLDESVFGPDGQSVRKVRLRQLQHDGPLAVKKVTSTAAWVSAEVLRVGSSDNAQEAELLVTVKKSDDYGLSGASINVFCEGAETPTTIDVRQNRGCPFEVKPKVVHFALGGNTTERIQVLPTGQARSFEIESVAADKKRVAAEWEHREYSSPADITLRPVSMDALEQTGWAAENVTVRIRSSEGLVELPVAVILQGKSPKVQSTSASAMR